MTIIYGHYRRRHPWLSPRGFGRERTIFDSFPDLSGDDRAPAESRLARRLGQGVLDLAALIRDNPTLPQPAENALQLLIRQVVLEQCANRAAEGIERPGSARVTTSQGFDAGIHPVGKRSRVQQPDQRHGLDGCPTKTEDLLRLELANQRLETGVPGDDEEERPGTLLGQTPDVVRDVKSERILAVPFDSNVLGVASGRAPAPAPSRSTRSSAGRRRRPGVLPAAV